MTRPTENVPQTIGFAAEFVRCLLCDVEDLRKGTPKATPRLTGGGGTKV